MNKTKKCECGRTVTLYGYDEECSCGRLYNAFGQRLGPRMLWSDDGDGFYGMNEGEEYRSPPKYEHPEKLYHATYRPLLKKIKKDGGLFPGRRKNWEDSKLDRLYLAVTPDIAESYAESSEEVPESWLDEIIILEIKTQNLDRKLFNIDANVLDNTGDTLEYSGYIPLKYISFL